MQTIIVAVSGKRLSGKDTLARLVQSTLGDGVCQVISLADALKVEYCSLFDADIERLYTDPTYKELHRQGLIDHGATRRAEDIDYWCRKLMGCINRPIVMVPDLRFTNEATFFRERSNYISVRIITENSIRARRGWIASPADVDVTETQMDGWDDWDYIIENNGTLNNLLRQAEPLINQLKKEVPLGTRYIRTTG